MSDKPYFGFMMDQEKHLLSVLTESGWFMKFAIDFEAKPKQENKFVEADIRLQQKILLF